MDLIVSLKSFSFTNSFYTINNNNNQFLYTYDNITIHTFTLVNSNYSIDDLMTYLNLAFLGIFVFSYSLQSYKVTITSTTSTPFRLVSTQAANNVYEVLGFDDFIPYTTLATAYTGPYLFNMMGVQVLHICLPTINLASVGLKNTTKYNIIDSIQVISTSGETQTYFNDNNFKYKVNENSIPLIFVAIYDQDFNLVDFNNIDWYMNITIQYVYEKQFIAGEYLTNNVSDVEIAVLQAEKKSLLNNM